ncbi:MAG: hypothetical protein ACD_30C00028G0003 [uncultured bacterium]|uniref:Uncharacterized protein n=3 Tax=Candidatus Daviesiibacteriota TaxID=1752718 RepID=A0A0G0F8J4_9BACT|nr:MAG: hypothetical protein ACD_30C00028G0003 [uncultured bacterium]KKQ09820.1 MAG: hypothetical protein US19_C0011G0023 [Candidatus Daviesbacteria bacterium GW2011_GWB1_36_5]KKQ14077.1 MAG: hypothetical protein US28_C0040G0018 [Candidatus Daviesbacteria bacterium GW2011_GWA1_36_8]OGE32294.1 MAG: hypothetical protein A3C99_03475 [Candidatus Daviesbacteria bacterium RIFCSPHIGHO2_02_FULL_37_9]OGE35571.1 MAG: hypothetical protein A3E66_02345 [Candidatus Daviesbacteria bacterium RIFCSPHIGHO2_12_FU
MKEFFKELKESGTLSRKGQIMLGLLIISGLAAFDFISGGNRDQHQPSIQTPVEKLYPTKTATLQTRPDTLRGAVETNWKMASFTPSPVPSPDTK